MQVYEVYDERGDFVALFLDVDEAYEYAHMHEQERNSWEVRKSGRESGGTV